MVLPVKTKDIVESTSQPLRSVSLFPFIHCLLILLLCVVLVSMSTVAISIFLHSLALINALCPVSEEHHLCSVTSANAIHLPNFCDIVPTATQ
jgi:hypothetical protein